MMDTMNSTDASKAKPPLSNDDVRSVTSSSGRVVLKKEVKLTSAIGLIVGTIIGSGIFISPKGVANGAGSVALSLLLWGIGGLASMFASLSIAELGTMIPTSAGEYMYIYKAYAAWLAYLWSWTFSILMKPSSQAILSLTCAQYILVPFFEDGCGEPPESYRKLLASAILLLIAAINVFSVKLAARIQVFFTGAKLIALLIIVIGGIVKLAQGYTENLATGFENSNANAGQVIMGFYSAMFAYDGWNNLNAVTEEIQNPSRIIPLALSLSIPLITVLYLMANVSYFTVMSVDELLASPAVAITWAQRVIPEAWWIMPVFVAMSTFGACNGSLFTVGRLFLVAAREGHQMEILAMIHVKRFTPMPGIVFSAFFAIIFIQAGAVTELIDFLSFAVWMFHALSMIAVIVLRFKMKDAHRPYKVPLVLPILVFIFAAVLVIVPLVLEPQLEFLYATLVMLAGFIFWVPFVYFKLRIPCIRKVYLFFQLLMQVAPPTSEVQKVA